MKILTLIIFSFTCFGSYSQTVEVEKNNINDVVTFLKDNVVQDSLLASYPLLVSAGEDKVVITGKGEALKKINDNNNALLFPVPSKGIIHLKIDILPDEFMPTLELCNVEGSFIHKIFVRNKISTINMEKVPSGKYTLTLNLDRKHFSWVIEKE